MEFWESLARTAVALAIVLGLMLAALKVFRRLHGGIGAGSDAGPVVRILGSSPLDTRKHIAVVAVAEQWLIVGVTPDTIVPLGRVRQGMPPAERPASPPLGKTFGRSDGMPAPRDAAER